MTAAQRPAPAAVWNSLTTDDRTEFSKLRTSFHQAQKSSSKDPRLVSFSNELHTIIRFIDRAKTGQEGRSIISGVAFAGPFICVNTRQLRDFLGRCKSSINGSLQQLGYVALRTKSKARACLLTVMPSLVDDQNNLRQWTVRYASREARSCFVTSQRFPQLPQVTEDDLNDDHREPEPTPVRIESAPIDPVMSTSMSVECFSSYADPCNDEDEWNPMWEGHKRRGIPRSQSYFADDGDVCSYVPGYF